MSKIDINLFFKKWLTEFKKKNSFSILFFILKDAYCENACTPLSVLPAPIILILVFRIFFKTFSIVS